ncbi:Piwi domain-containing protein [Mycena albidolilacea]|uniref:Piwi domain-containing protein n=1 Tax=Mycena albidolilacea TaxID=1033008 RepID=A0AAD7A4C1_9AGAR|nr:Piwi domain-containing protein [Mycena albidolilacea]
MAATTTANAEAQGVQALQRFGTLGDPTKALVYTNAYELPSFHPNAIIHHYDVITPEWTQKTEVKFSEIKSRDIIVRLQQQEPRIFNPVGGQSSAFDGKHNLFSFARYSLASSSESLDSCSRFRILRDLRKAEPQDVASAINLLNVFVQAQPKRRERFSQSFCLDLCAQSETICSIQQVYLRSIAPLQIWKGLFQSVRPTIDRIVVNVDTTVGIVVPERSLARLCEEYLRVNDLGHIDSSQFQQLRHFLRGVKVIAHHAGRREPRALKIRDLVPFVGEEIFEKVVRHGDVERKVRISVAEHFRDNYNITIPPGSLGVRGSRELFPISCCRTILQLYRNKLSPDKAAKVLKFGLKTPRDKLRDIENEWAALDHRESEFLRGGGITFSASSHPLKVNGRRLDSPKILYGPSRYRPNGPGEIQTLERPGSWNMVEKTFKEPATIGSWVIVNFTQRSNSTKLNQFMRNLYQAMDKLVVNPPQEVTGVPNAVHRILNEACHTHRPNLLVVILNEFDMDLYQAVKRFGDITAGVATQCIKWTRNRSDASDRQTSQYHANLLLKINARMGGVNFVPNATKLAMQHLAKQPTMILGADVSHPSPQSTLPSMAGLVSSWDIDACKYGASVRLQRSRLEIIEDLEAMVGDALNLFMSNNRGKVPTVIWYYRDGVSEGQFDAVFKFEYAAILNACRKLDQYSKLKPNVAFIVCGKRHHTRFFPRDTPSTDHNGKGNCWAGLVGLQGSKRSHCRPTHFTVLGEQPPMNLVQELSYTLCHCYSRATKSVKIPAPLVCRRAKFHYDEAVDYFDDISVDSDNPAYASKQLDFYKKHFHPIHENLRDTMYFV